MGARVTAERGEWAAVTAAFSRFFDGLGVVDVDGRAARFRADETGFDLAADGGSSAFMPLHEARIQWTEVTFDLEAATVTLSDGGSTYVYRVPQRLVDDRDARRGSNDG